MQRSISSGEMDSIKDENHISKLNKIKLSALLKIGGNEK